MKKKKTHAKLLQHSVTKSRSGHRCPLRPVNAPTNGRSSALNKPHHYSKPLQSNKLRCLTLTVCFTLLLAGCAVLSNPSAEKVKYANPPKVGAWLQSQRELVACETVAAARHMADFGFFHPQCKQLIDISPQDYRVESREIVHLQEGPMWLLRVEHNKRIYFVPIPWHDWA